MYINCNNDKRYSPLTNDDIFSWLLLNCPFSILHIFWVACMCLISFVLYVMFYFCVKFLIFHCHFFKWFAQNLSTNYFLLALQKIAIWPIGNLKVCLNANRPMNICYVTCIFFATDSPDVVCPHRVALCDVVDVTCIFFATDSPYVVCPNRVALCDVLDNRPPDRGDCQWCHIRQLYEDK